MRITLDEEIAATEDAVDVLKLDRELQRSHIVELRYFAGLTVEKLPRRYT